MGPIDHVEDCLLLLLVDEAVDPLDALLGGQGFQCLGWVDGVRVAHELVKGGVAAGGEEEVAVCVCVCGCVCL